MPTLRQARVRKLLTLRALSDLAGVPISVIFDIERGKTTPRFKTMQALSAALGLAPEEIDEFRLAIERKAAQSSR